MIQVIHRISAILDAIEELGSAEFKYLCAKTKLHKSTLSNLLKTLIEVGYVEKTSDKRYRIGPSIMRLARENLDLERLREIAGRHAINLNNETNELAAVVAWWKGQRHTLAKVDSQKSLMVNAELVTNAYYFNNSTGQILLANMSDQDLNQIIKDKGFSCEVDDWSEINSKSALKQKLSEIRDEQTVIWQTPDKQIESLGVLSTVNDNLVLAIGAAYPVARVNAKKKNKIISALQKCADALKKNIDSI